MKAISPVIATVIIVAVTIAIAVAVALWLTGMVSPFTTVENLQIISAVPTKTTTSFSVTITIKNTGTSTATIDGVFINGKYYKLTEVTDAGADSVSIDPGSTKTIIVDLSKTTGQSFSSGQMVEIKFHTASGKEYPKTVTLP